MTSTRMGGQHGRRLLQLGAAATIGLAGLAPVTAGLAAPPLQQDIAALPMAAADYCVEPEELAFLDDINAYRAQYGLAPLRISQTLGAAAAEHSDSMAETSFFDHSMADGTTVEQNIREHGYVGSTYGENIAAGTETADYAFSTWQNSPAHNENMLQTSYESIGIARAYNANSGYGWYWTTIFGGPLDFAADVCGEPTQYSAFAAGAALANLNLRSGPGTGFSIVTEVPNGAALDVTGTEEDGYVPVSFSGFTGWVAADYVKQSAASAAAPAATETATVKSLVNFRIGPGTTYGTQGTIPAGTSLTVNGVAEGGFLPVTYNGLAGWVATDFVDYTAAPVATSATTTQALNLRAGPSATDPILLVIPASATVGLTGTNSNGYLGVTYGTTQGWADAAYLATTAGTGQLSGFSQAPAATAATTTAAPAQGEVMATANLNLRSGAGAESAVLTVVPRGSIMTLTGGAETNGYVPVSYNGTTGWVDVAYLG